MILLIVRRVQKKEEWVRSIIANIAINIFILKISMTSMSLHASTFIEPGVKENGKKMPTNRPWHGIYLQSGRHCGDIPGKQMSL